MAINQRLDDLLDATVVFSFTNIGHKLRRSGWDEIPRMDGRTVVVTGATSGIGRAASEAMAGLGAQVILVARNPAKAEQTATEMAESTGTHPEVEIADLSLMSEVRDVAARLAQRGPIHVLVNNAGALFTERGVTAEGNERSLSLNLMSPFLLTNLLIPHMVESAPARIITVASGGMYTQKVELEDMQYERGEYKGSVAYARAKRGQVILTGLWAEQLAGRGVVVHAMHPGWADTPGVEKSLPTFRKITGPFLRTAAEGADTIVWLAAAPAPAEAIGLFWLDRRPRPTHKLGSTRETPAEREALWEALVELTGWEPDE